MTVAKPIGHHVGALLGWMYIMSLSHACAIPLEVSLDRKCSCSCHTTGGLPRQEIHCSCHIYHWRPLSTGMFLFVSYHWSLPRQELHFLCHTTGGLPPQEILLFACMPVNPCLMPQNKDLLHQVCYLHGDHVPNSFNWTPGFDPKKLHLIS